jgi:phosphoribosyl-dephospho-CoA transferase
MAAGVRPRHAHGSPQRAGPDIWRSAARTPEPGFSNGMTTSNYVPRVHDLLLLNSGRVVPARENEPCWARAALEHCPWVVVRREHADECSIAVGVRGVRREQRWAGLVDLTDVRQAICPGLLRSGTAHPMRRPIPAIEALRYVESKLAGWSAEWGPVGSLGYELATGLCVTREDSDLDLVICAPQSIDREMAHDLFNVLRLAPAKVDIRIETPFGGFSLEEYAREGAGKVLLRTATGRVLVQDPWATLPGTELR